MLIKTGRRWSKDFELAHRVYQHDQAQMAGDLGEAERIKRFFREQEGMRLTDHDSYDGPRLQRE